MFVKRHHAQRVQIETRVGNLLGVILDGLAGAAIDTRQPADAQLLVAEKAQSQSGAVDRYNQQVGLLEFELFDQLCADGR
jgi:hypothetical protein